MFKLADLMENNAEYIAKLDTLDNGKPLTTAIEDVEGSVACLRYFAGKYSLLLKLKHPFCK